MKVNAARVALVVGLFAGFGASCVVEHPYDLDDFICPAHLRPECCDSCAGEQPIEAACTATGWTCPPPSVSIFDCPGHASFCQPNVVIDTGVCSADAGQVPSQALYTFPGCSPAGTVCANDLTLRCALASVKAQYDECVFSADCVAAPIDGGCTGFGTCAPFSVTAANKAVFTPLANAEVARYCECPACSWSTVCSADAGAPACRYGRCTWVPAQVQYACADRTAGACYAACAQDEACFTQVACNVKADGGCAVPPDAGAPQGDELCHRRCLSDGGCPSGQTCFQVPFYGCLGWDGGAPPTASICCSGDAGCG